MALNTRSGVFGHFLRMDLFTFHEKDGHISWNDVNQTGTDTLWEAAAHTSKLHHKLLQELLGQSFSRMTCCILGMTLDMVGAFLLVECVDNGLVDLVNL